MPGTPRLAGTAGAGEQRAGNGGVPGTPRVPERRGAGCRGRVVRRGRAGDRPARRRRWLLAVHGSSRHNGCVISEAGLATAARARPPGPARAQGSPGADELSRGGLTSAVSAAELALARLAVRIGAERVAGWSPAEQRLADAAESGQRLPGVAEPGPHPAAGPGPDPAARPGPHPAAEAGLPAVVAGLSDVTAIRAQIRAGADPLGEAFCRIRSATQRRSSGQTFTPAPVVAAMVDWAAATVRPARVVDPGTGSARFLAAAGRAGQRRS